MSNKVDLKLNVQDCVENAGELAAGIDNVSDSEQCFFIFLDKSFLKHKLGNISRLFKTGKEGYH
jgi:hypothetical protein